MPSGKVHAATSAFTASVLVSSALVPGVDKQFVVAAAAGCLSGVFLSPDLDVDAGYIGLYYIRKYFGEILSVTWQWLWKPYAVLMPHRSRASHTPVLGTMLRLLYLYLSYLVLGSLSFYAFGWPRQVYIVPLKKALLVFIRGHAPFGVEMSIAAFAGLCISDALHALMDLTATTLKRSRRRHKTWQFTLSDVGNALRKSK